MASWIARRDGCWLDGTDFSGEHFSLGECLGGGKAADVSAGFLQRLFNGRGAPVVGYRDV